MRLIFYYTPIVIFVLCLYGHASSAQHDTDAHQIYLLGNTADIEEQSQLDDLLHFFKNRDSSIIVLNGDLINIKANRLPQTADSIKISKLLAVLTDNQNNRVLLLPGDRDWDNSGKHGWDAFLKLQAMVDQMKFDRVEWIVRDGCPGPAVIKVSPNLRLMGINTQWFNHPYDIPKGSNANCLCDTKERFYTQLENELNYARSSNFIMLGHYPIYSYGKYAGYYPLGQYFNPPIYALFRNSYRQNVGRPIDLSNKRFKEFSKVMSKIIKSRGNIIYAGGHERSIQVLKQASNYYINSGSIAKSDFVASFGDKIIYDTDQTGLIQISVYPKGKITYTVHHLKDKGHYTLASDLLYQSTCDLTSLPDIPYNEVNQSCRKEIVDKYEVNWPDSGLVNVGGYRPKKATKWLFGKMYKEAWNAKIKAPYLDAHPAFKNFEITGRINGIQNSALFVLDDQKKINAFFAVDRNVDVSIPYELQGTIVENFLHEFKTSQFPYSTTVIHKMLDSTSILHTSPELYIMPPTAKLGVLYKNYDNTLGYLTGLKVSPDNKGIYDNRDVLSSRSMFVKLYDNSINQVDLDAYIRARMFDILVGDWGKNEDNWYWFKEKDNPDLLLPMPINRRYAFSKFNGIIPYLADRSWWIKGIENFDYKIRDLQSLVYSSLAADRRLLANLPAEEFEKAAQYVQAQMEDAKIEEAVRHLPKNIFEDDGQELISKLIQRKTDLQKYARTYQKIVAKNGLEIVGSNIDEYFQITRKADGSVRIQLYPLDANQKPILDQMRLDRTVAPMETNEIRLYGLDGDDVFVLRGTTKESMKLRIIGCEGDDSIIDESVVKNAGKKTLVYEKSETSKIELNKTGRRVKSWNDKLYDYDRQRFGYNSTAPLIGFVLNNAQGVGLELGFESYIRKPMKDDFASNYVANFLLTTKQIRILELQARWHHIVHKWDLVGELVIANKDRRNQFYGIGNNTFIIGELLDRDYYKVDYRYNSISLGVRRDFWRKSKFVLTFGYQNNNVKVIDGTYLDEHPEVYGRGEHNYYNLQALVNLNFFDEFILPSRGVNLQLKNRLESSFIENEGYFGNLNGFLSQTITFEGKKPLTIGYLFGGGINYGAKDKIPFYKLDVLGQRDNLIAFDYNRFTGYSSLHLNMATLFQFADLTHTFLNVKTGLIAFINTARVYSPHDDNRLWHTSVGGGFYFVPSNKNLTVNFTLATNREYKLFPMLRLGNFIKLGYD